MKYALARIQRYGGANEAIEFIEESNSVQNLLEHCRACMLFFDHQQHDLTLSGVRSQV
jgi:hypothetical protein